MVAVAAKMPGRRFIDLPALEYRFQVQAACTGSRTPRSLSISIADSRVALAGAALDGEGARELVLTVPGRQLAPIAVDDFCVAAPAAEPAPEGYEAASSFTAASVPPRLLTVPAVVTAQASLVCSDEGGSHISYVTKPLAVTLACAADEDSERQPGQQGAGRDAAR